MFTVFSYTFPPQEKCRLSNFGDTANIFNESQFKVTPLIGMYRNVDASDCFRFRTLRKAEVVH